MRLSKSEDPYLAASADRPYVKARRDRLRNCRCRKRTTDAGCSVVCAGLLKTREETYLCMKRNEVEELAWHREWRAKSVLVVSEMGF